MKTEWKGEPPYGYCTTTAPKRNARKMIVNSVPFKDIKTNKGLQNKIRAIEQLNGRTPTWLALEEAKKMFLNESLGSRSNDSSVRKLVFTFTDGISSFNDPNQEPYLPLQRRIQMTTLTHFF